MSPLDKNTFLHEVGHAMTLQHANRDGIEYGDTSDV
jgi:hypothetical protein